jgi:CBS domain-containing protein
MRVKEVMSDRPEYLDVSATIREAAMRMKKAGRGFTPIAKNDKLVGILTDRDITVRAMAEGKAPTDKVSSILTSSVLYCYENDDVADVLQNMHDQEVQRLIVLNNDKNMDVAGVVSLSDIADNCTDDELGRCIVNACRHYH